MEHNKHGQCYQNGIRTIKDEEKVKSAELNNLFTLFLLKLTILKTL